MTSVLIRSVLLIALATAAACGPKTKAVASAAGQGVVACAKATGNQLIAQATDALLTAAGRDPKSVGAFLDSLALDAASAGVSDAIGFATCVAEAVKTKLADLAKNASLDPGTYTQVMDGLSAWESAHPATGR